MTKLNSLNRLFLGDSLKRNSFFTEIVKTMHTTTLFCLLNLREEIRNKGSAGSII